MTDPFAPITLKSGQQLPNRLVLAALTNSSSHDDGTLGEDELRFLALRAKGGFGLVSTCASHVSEDGKGFPGQLGCWGDHQLPGLTRVADAINSHGALSSVQLYHGGLRCPADLIGRTPWSPSAQDRGDGSLSEALPEAQILRIIEDFAAAAARVERAGFKGVELHGAHSYLICQFLSPETNSREDQWGGDFAGRSRFLWQVLDAVAAATGSGFSIGVRISPERFGLVTAEMVELSRALAGHPRVDYVHVSLWDSFKAAEDGSAALLMAPFVEAKVAGTPLLVAGKLATPEDCQRALALGADVLALGRAAIGNHDFPARMAENPGWQPFQAPHAAEQLQAREGLGDAFLGYMRRWQGYVAD